MAVTSLCAKLSSDKYPEMCVTGVFILLSVSGVLVPCSPSAPIGERCVCSWFIFARLIANNLRKKKITKDPKNRTCNYTLVRFDVRLFQKLRRTHPHRTLAMRWKLGSAGVTRGAGLITPYTTKIERSEL
ncbi:unnamed protein product [Ectocarpus sp. 12 AP-2014]